jgi:hypothetical protein
VALIHGRSTSEFGRWFGLPMTTLALGQVASLTCISLVAPETGVRA